MNPTFNLSAAEAPLPTLPASRSAAAAARNGFLMVNLQTVGGTTVHDAAPHRARPEYQISGPARTRCPARRGPLARADAPRDTGQGTRRVPGRATPHNTSHAS